MRTYFSWIWEISEYIAKHDTTPDRIYVTSAVSYAGRWRKHYNRGETPKEALEKVTGLKVEEELCVSG